MDTRSEEQEKKRFLELAYRAEKTGQCVYTEFHSMHGVALAHDAARGICEVTEWGGYPDAERMMIGFGTDGNSGFPVTLIRISPKQQKYADKLSHRDFLGALMNLGIERDVLGDIIVSENTGYVFAAEGMADFIMESISSVKHTAVNCEVIDSLPEDAKPKWKQMEINVSSLRADAIVSKAFNLSRGNSKDLFSSEDIAVNGAVLKNPGKEPDEGDVISVRGYGKFKYCGALRETKKGNLVCRIEKYV